MKKKIMMSLFLALLFPSVVTLAWSGGVGGWERHAAMESGKRILLDRGTTVTAMDVEEYLCGIVAKQIPPDYGKEALKAQAMIARTYLYGIMGDENEMPESALDLDYPEEKQLRQMWGREKMAEYYKNIKEAVEETKGQVITYEGSLITPLFHRASTGRTRESKDGLAYIKAVESNKDVEADGFLQMQVFTTEDFAARIREIPEAGELKETDLFSQIQLISKDESGYVEEIQIGSRSYTGEEIQYALGLPSASFALEDYEGNVRAVVKGIGHGYGMSQYGAKVKASEGWTAEEILAYYYSGAEAGKVPGHGEPK
ncbi:SpoIID/LytB domain-containing protein [Lachnospiraceae bacterium 62-35]